MIKDSAQLKLESSILFWKMDSYTVFGFAWVKIVPKEPVLLPVFNLGQKNSLWYDFDQSKLWWKLSHGYCAHKFYQDFLFVNDTFKLFSEEVEKNSFTCNLILPMIPSHEKACQI